MQEFVYRHFNFFRRRKRLICVYELDGSRNHGRERSACRHFVVLQRGFDVGAFKTRLDG